MEPFNKVSIISAKIKISMPLKIAVDKKKKSKMRNVCKTSEL